MTAGGGNTEPITRQGAATLQRALEYLARRRPDWFRMHYFYTSLCLSALCDDPAKTARERRKAERLCRELHRAARSAHVLAREPTITSEHTLAVADISDARQAAYQRKMSTLLGGTTAGEAPS